MRKYLLQLRGQESQLVDEVGWSFENVVEHVDDVFAGRLCFGVGGTAARRDMRDVHHVDVACRAG